MRLAFLGSPPFGTPVLRHLLDSRHEVAVVVSPPDRPRGRGRSVERSPLAVLAAERGAPLLRPETTRDGGFLESLRGYAPEVLLVASYGEILRAPVLELAPHGALNVHASLLPRWRGAAPIQHAILAGDTETGVCVQRMVLALDEGDVLLERRTPIGAEETAGELAARLAELGGEVAVEALDRLEAGEASFTPQDPKRATYAPKLSRRDGELDWTRPAVELARRVRAMTPWPGARTTLPDGRALVVLAAAAEPSEPAGEPGALLPGPELRVATGEGALLLRTVKPEGRGAMEGAAFLRGARLAPGARLGRAESP